MKDIGQAKRKFAEKWSRPINSPYDDDEAADEVLSDLNALIEKVIEERMPTELIEKMRHKLLSMRSTKEAMDKLSEADRLMMYGYHDCINEMLMWTKSMKGGEK